MKGKPNRNTKHCSEGRASSSGGSPRANSTMVPPDITVGAEADPSHPERQSPTGGPLPTEATCRPPGSSDESVYSAGSPLNNSRYPLSQGHWTQHRPHLVSLCPAVDGRPEIPSHLNKGRHQALRTGPHRAQQSCHPGLPASGSLMRVVRTLASSLTQSRKSLKIRVKVGMGGNEGQSSD